MEDLRVEHHSALNEERFKQWIWLAIRSFRFQLLWYETARHIGIIMEKMVQQKDFLWLYQYIQGIFAYDEWFPAELRVNWTRLSNIPSALGNLKIPLQTILNEIEHYYHWNETQYDAKYSKVCLASRESIDQLLFPSEPYWFWNSNKT